MTQMRSRSWMTAMLLTLATMTAGCASGSGVAGDRTAGTIAQQGTAAPASPEAAGHRHLPQHTDAPPTPPAFQYAYLAPRSPDLEAVHARVRDTDLLRSLPELHAIDGMFLLPVPLRFVTAECGEFGAFYRVADTEVVLCYETLRTLYERGQAQQHIQGLDDDHPRRYVQANVRFIVLHETGHALVHLLDLPVTGRQEDAVDQLAAILMLRFSSLDETPVQVIDNLRMAANWMLSRSTGAYNLDAYADEHALGEQRYFNLQCLVYGTDPEGFSGMVDAGDLTAARANGCARETRLVTRAWLRLLLPYLAPAYAAYRAEASAYLQATDPPHLSAPTAGPER